MKYSVAQLKSAQYRIDPQNLSPLSVRSDTKEMKKKLEAKRLERIQAMTKVTTDKVAQER